MPRYGIRVTTYRTVAVQAVHYYGEAWRQDGNELTNFEIERTLDRTSAAELTRSDNRYGGIQYRYHAGETAKRFESRETLLHAGVTAIREPWKHDGAVDDGATPLRRKRRPGRPPRRRDAKGP